MNSMGSLSSKKCVRCEALPCKAKGSGHLYLWFPTQHTRAKLSAYLQKAGIQYELMESRPGLSAACRPKQLEKLNRQLPSLLTSRELQDTQALFVTGSVQPDIQDFSDITSLQRFIRFNESDWLLLLLMSERLTSHFQPIVYAEDPTRVFGYEALLRGLDEQGNLIMPSQIFALAKDAGLMAPVDLAARRCAIRQASRHQIAQPIFINFSPTAIYDPIACLQATVQAIDEAGIPHENIVFEVIESDQPQDCSHLETILKYYREHGFIVALDDFGAGYSSLNMLHQLRPDLIKLDRELIRDVHQDPYKALITEKILEIAQQLDIRTVAEGIEVEGELQWLRDRGATFVQGFYIARPSEIPPIPMATQTEAGLAQPS